MIDKDWELDNESLELIKAIVLIRNPNTILEIGTYKGTTVKNISTYSKAKITTLEKDPAFYSIAKKRLESTNINLIHGNAKEIIPTLTGFFDLVFIDAMKKEYITYLNLLEDNKLINNKTIIIADNVISHEIKVKKYIDYVKINYNSQTIKIGKGLEVSKK